MLKNIQGGFSAVDSSTLLKLVPSVLMIGAYTGLAYYIEYMQLHFDLDFKPTTTVFSLLGIVLGLLLVFRTNTAYERWWEGRRLLGGLTDSSRNLAIKLHAFLPMADKENRTWFALMIGNYYFAIKEHLREGVDFNEMEEAYPGMNEELKRFTHIPNRINAQIMTRINDLAKKGVFTQEQMIIMDNQDSVFTQVIGGCERIKGTPIPTSYSKHLDRFMLLYTLMLPFGLMHDLGWYTVPVIMIVYFALEGIKIIGEEIEDPFGRDANDLKTDLLATRVRANVKEILLPPGYNELHP